MTSKTMKLGKLPARKDAVKLRLSKYLVPAALPKPPRTFGHEALLGADWSVLGNDQWGDCVFAGAAHETMMWCREAGAITEFDDKSVLSDYSAVTGFDPTNPDTDQGTDMQAAASYRRKVGIVDAIGNRHKIDAYLAIEPGNLTQHYLAMYLFGAVGIGIQFPGSAMSQFNRGKTWSVVKGAQVEGGHYLPLIAKRTNIKCVTWGRVQGMTAGFFSKYNDESLAYLSAESLVNRKSPEGFDYGALLADLHAIASPVP